MDYTDTSNSTSVRRRLYSTCDAAVSLGISRSLLYRLIQDGVIKSVRIGSRRLVAESELDRYVDSLTQ